MYFVFFMRETTYTVCSHGKENLLDRVNQTDVRMTLKYYTSSSIDMSHTISIDFTIDYIQSNFSGSNTFGTMKISSRQG